MKTAINVAIIFGGIFYISAHAQSKELEIVSCFLNEHKVNETVISNDKIIFHSNLENKQIEISTKQNTENFPKNRWLVKSMDFLKTEIVSFSDLQDSSTSVICNLYNRNKYIGSKKTSKLLAWNIYKKTLSPALTLPIYTSKCISSPHNFMIYEKQQILGISAMHFNRLLTHPFVIVDLKTNFCNRLLEKNNSFQLLKQSGYTFKFQCKNNSFSTVADNLKILKARFLWVPPYTIPNTCSIQINKDATSLQCNLLRLKIK